MTHGGFLAGLDTEQRLRYYVWWRKYVFLRRLSRVAFGLMLVLWVVSFRYADFRMERIFRLFVVWVCFALALWWVLLDCPRCGQSFNGWTRIRYFPDECQNCGLSGMELSSIAKPTDHP